MLFGGGDWARAPKTREKSAKTAGADDSPARVGHLTNTTLRDMLDSLVGEKGELSLAFSVRARKEGSKNPDEA